MNLGTNKSTKIFSFGVEEVALIPSQTYPISPGAYDNILTFFIKFVNNTKIGPLSPSVFWEMKPVTAVFDVGNVSS